MTISDKQPEKQILKLHNQDVSFEEGFLLTPDKLQSIVKTIDENLRSKSFDYYLDISVEYIRNRDKKRIENKPFKSIEELVSDNNALNKSIKSVRLNIRSKKTSQSLATQDAMECIIDYGSQDVIYPNTKNKLARIFLQVSGTDHRWVNQFLGEVSDEIKRTLMNPWLSKFIKAISSVKNFLLIFTILVHIVFLIFLGVQAQPFQSTISDLENAQNKLNNLYQESKDVSNESQKIDFLFQERILLNEIQFLSEEAKSGSTNNIKLNWKNILRISLFLIIFCSGLVSFGFLYPLENFMWGDYVSYYGNLGKTRGFLLVGVALAALVNLVTGYF